MRFHRDFCDQMRVFFRELKKLDSFLFRYRATNLFLRNIYLKPFIAVHALSVWCGAITITRFIIPVLITRHDETAT